MKKNITYKLPKEGEEVYNKFKNFPYYIHKSGARLQKYTVVGKGSPEAIEKHLQNIVKKRIDDPKERRQLMQDNKLGIDCSGFVSYILDAIVYKKTGNHIWKYIKKPTINPIKVLAHKTRPISSKLNAATLTSDLNTVKINNINDIKVGDLIRFNGGAHVAIINQVEYFNNRVKSIKYIHSTEGAGVSEGIINIKDDKKPLEMQEWKEVKGAKFQPLYLFKKKVNNNGIRRLKYINLFD